MDDAIDDIEEMPDDAIEEEYDEYEDDLNVDVEDKDTEETLADVLEYEEEPLQGQEEPAQKIIGIDEKDDNHKIIRVIADSDRITSEIIQLNEMAEAIGIRISQIENGAPILTDVSGYKSPIEMAKKEFIDRQNPLIVQRRLQTFPTEDLVEHWKVRDMVFPITNREIFALTTKQISEIAPATAKKKTK